MDGHTPTFLLPTPKIVEHCADVAGELLRVGFPRAANFRENRIGLHG
jgi:hypothetical protein